MEIEDFEFDLSDVAAFESVATEDTTSQAVIQLNAQDITTSQQSVSATNAHQQEHDSHNQDPQSQDQQHQQLGQDSEQTQPQPTPTKPLQPIVPAAGSAGKILLVPLNTKPGAPGFKHLFQLPPGSSPLTMGALTTTSTNQRPMIQLTPLPASNLQHMGKNNYQIPITTSSQLLPGSSQSQEQQVQHLYFTTTKQAASATGSPNRSQQQQQQQQTLNLNNVLNKSLVSNLHNVSSSQFNSANLSSLRNQSFNDRALTPNPSATNEVPKRKPCNCTKSQCLKLYCDCFANGEFCSGCNCTNCFNSLSKEKERQKAISQCLERNPEAFRPKIGKAVKLSEGEPEPDAIERRHTKGCNCKRSGCLKNYCECYESKILCSNLCKCCGCKNYEESFERKSLMQLNSSASENARGILKNLLPTNNNSSTGKEFTKSFITDKVIHASLMCLLQSAQQAEKDGIQASNIPSLIQLEMGKCLRMIVDSATESFSSKKR